MTQMTHSAEETLEVRKVLGLYINKKHDLKCFYQSIFIGPKLFVEQCCQFNIIRQLGILRIQGDVKVL